MNPLWAVACGAGLQDGLNPCIFMSCAVFLSQRSWAQKSPVFAIVYAASVLLFDFGPAQTFVLHKEFVFAAKIIYAILSIWGFAAGVLALKDWFLIRRKGDVAGELKQPLNAQAASLIVVLLSIALSALATLWPMNTYMMLLGNEALLKGRGYEVIPFLAGYAVTSLWPLWIIWAFFSIKKMPASWLKIMGAAVFFTASSCIILIFK